MDRFKQLVDYHLRRLHKHTKYHLSTVEHQHKKHLNERQYQNNKHELNVRHLHKKHEYYLKKHGYRYGHGYGHSLIHHRYSHGGKGKIKSTKMIKFVNTIKVYNNYNLHKPRTKTPRSTNLQNIQFDKFTGFVPATRHVSYMNLIALLKHPRTYLV